MWKAKRSVWKIVRAIEGENLWFTIGTSLYCLRCLFRKFHTNIGFFFESLICNTFADMNQSLSFKCDLWLSDKTSSIIADLCDILFVVRCTDSHPRLYTRIYRTLHVLSKLGSQLYLSDSQTCKYDHSVSQSSAVSEVHLIPDLAFAQNSSIG